MLRVKELILNNQTYVFTDSNQPSGLYDAEISFKRDSDYYGHNIEIETSLDFHCDSFKQELDQAFLSNNIDNNGFLIIEYVCDGLQPMPFRFLIDWKSYNLNTTRSTFKLISESPLSTYLKTDDNDLTLDSSKLEDVYVRKLGLRYNRLAYDFGLRDYADDGNIKRRRYNVGMDRYSYLYIFPSSKTSINELEESTTITSEIISLQKDHDFPTNSQEGVDGVTNVFNGVAYSVVEPEPIFTNKLSKGVLTIKEEGNNNFEFTAKQNTPYNFRYRWEHTRTVFVVGKRYDKPRLIYEFYLGIYNNQPQQAMWNDFTNTASDFNFFIGDNSPNVPINEFDVTINEGESVWHQYSIKLKSVNALIGQGNNQQNALHFDSTELDVKTTRFLTTNFKLEEYTVNNLGSVNEATHHKIKMVKGENVSSDIFSLASDEFFTVNEFNDMYFSNGTYVRNSVEPKPIIVRPKAFFKDLEAVAPVGLGLFYNDNTNQYELILSESKNFWNNTVYKTYSLVDEVELKMGSIGVNDVSIGYEVYKDTSLSKNKKSEYNIQTSQHRNKYTRLSKFIADAYIWFRAIKLGTDIDGKEYDNNTFLLSAKKQGSGASAKIVSLSNSSGFAADNVTESNTNNGAVANITTWINRRYSSVFNLIRKSAQWRPSLDYIHQSLFNNTIYNSQIKISNSSYINNVFINQDKTLTKTDLDSAGAESPFENVVISFATPMNEQELIDLTKNWYSLIGVEDGNGNTYYGHILSCELSEGVASFELLKNK